MISMKVCFACVTFEGDFCRQYPEALHTMMVRSWREGRTVCPKTLAGFPGRGAVSVKEDPPKWCPRKFEHAIARGMTYVE